MLHRINSKLVLLTFILIWGCGDPMGDDNDPGGGDSSNTANAIAIEDCRPDGELLLENHSDGVDYIIDCNLRIENEGLIIQPGTTILFETGGGIFIDDSGYMVANGTASMPILFSSETKIMGSYKGIEIATNDTRNSLRYCTIEYAGEMDAGISNNKCALAIGNHISDTKTIVENCVIGNSSSIGIYIAKNSSLITFSNNKVQNTKLASVSARMEHVTAIKGDNQFIDSEQFDGVFLRWTTIDNNENITIDGLKVHFSEDSEIRGPLTIAPGSEIIMATDVQMVVRGNSSNQGRITANGTSSQPIIIRGEVPVSGYWAGILLEESALNNSFAHVKLSDGGGRKIAGSVTGQLGIANLVVGEGFFGEATRITLDNCEVNNSADCGVFVAKNSSYLPTNVSYNNNASGNVCLE